MTKRNIEIKLQLEVDDDWVRGSAAMHGGAPRPFYGWIGLVGAIEELARASGGTTPREAENVRQERAVR
jgi:hypothetical protein